MPHSRRLVGLAMLAVFALGYVLGFLAASPHGEGEDSTSQPVLANGLCVYSQSPSLNCTIVVEPSSLLPVSGIVLEEAWTHRIVFNASTSPPLVFGETTSITLVDSILHVDSGFKHIDVKGGAATPSPPPAPILVATAETVVEEGSVVVVEVPSQLSLGGGVAVVRAPHAARVFVKLFQGQDRLVYEYYGPRKLLVVPMASPVVEPYTKLVVGAEPDTMTDNTTIEVSFYQAPVILLVAGRGGGSEPSPLLVRLPVVSSETLANDSRASSQPATTSSR